MKRILFVALIVFCGITVNVYAAGIETYAFPQKGQTAEQQKQDEGYCATWAKDKTGLDPALLQSKEQEAAAQQQAAQQSAAPNKGRNLLRTAATGAALGGINNSMDDGAGKGAVAGVAVAASRNRAQSQEQAAQGAVNSANAQAQNVQADSQKYLKAYSACMEGKGYSIR
jgi:hypothetical protein